MTSPSKLSIPPSIPTDAGVLGGAIQILSQVEGLAPDATGALLFGTHGMILVQSRNICWAVAAGMKRRLSKLLRQQRSPPLEISYVEAVLRDCQTTGRPLGEALLADGQISEAGLRAALFSHVVEAVARIAGSHPRCEAFRPHVGTGFDPRFVFSTAEVLSALGARRNRALAAAARGVLLGTLLPESRGLSFVRDELGPVAIAVEGRPVLKVPEMLDLCRWACSLFDVSAVFDPGVRIATGCASDSSSVVAWRAADAHHVAVCANRASASLLMARVDAGFTSSVEARP